MPKIYGHDKNGNYVKWGNGGAKYHYNPNDPQSKAAAMAKMDQQRKAIEHSKHKGK